MGKAIFWYLWMLYCDLVDHGSISYFPGNILQVWWVVSFPRYGFLSHMVGVKVLLQGRLWILFWEDIFINRLKNRLLWIYIWVGRFLICSCYYFVMFSLIICRALLLISGGCTLSGMGAAAPSKTKIISVCY